MKHKAYRKENIELRDVIICNKLGEWYNAIEILRELGERIDDSRHVGFPYAIGKHSDGHWLSCTEYRFKSDSNFKTYSYNEYLNKLSKDSTSNEFVKGEVYVQLNRDLTVNRIFEFDEYKIFTRSEVRYSIIIYPNLKRYYIRGSFTYQGNLSNPLNRIATKEEKEWLFACKEAGKIIPKEDMKKLPNDENWIGKVVDVISVGRHFPTYFDMFRMLGLSNPDQAHNLSYNKNPSYYQNAIVTARYQWYVAIRLQNGKEHVVHVDGLRLVNNSTNSKFINKGQEFQPLMDSNLNNLTNHGNSKTNKGKAIEIDRLVSRITRGERPGGTIITGRTRRASIESRRISYTARVVKS